MPNPHICCQPHEIPKTQNVLQVKNALPTVIKPHLESLPHPLLWLSKQGGNSPFCDRYAITHGDLHGENIIIGQDNIARLVDFERTGWGPLLQDFVELEGDVLIRLIDYGKTCDFELVTYLHWLIQLYSPQKLGPLNGLREGSTDLLNKAQTTVGFLRTTAKTYHNDPRQYYWGVLLNAIYRMMFILERPDEIRPKFDQQYQRAYLLAAILCHRLAHWGQSDWGNQLWEKIKEAEGRTEKRDQFRQAHALIVGVGGDLPATLKDAQSLYDTLTDPQLSAYPEKQTHLLLGEKATPQAILEQLDQFSMISDPHSLVLLYFSGHGWRQSAEHRGLVCHNRTILLADELQQKLNAIPANLVVIFDTCYAGGMASTKAVLLEQEQTHPLPSEFLEKIGRSTAPTAHRHPRIIFSSSRDDQKSWLSKTGHSFYTEALLEELRRADLESSLVTTSHLMGVAKKVEAKVQKHCHAPQTPWYKADAPELQIALRPSPYKNKP